MDKGIKIRIVLGNILLILGFLLNRYFTFVAIIGYILFSGNKIIPLIPSELLRISMFFMFFIFGLIPYLLGILFLQFDGNKTLKLSIIISSIVHMISCLKYSFYL